MQLAITVSGIVIVTAAIVFVLGYLIDRSGEV